MQAPFHDFKPQNGLKTGNGRPLARPSRLRRPERIDSAAEAAGRPLLVTGAAGFIGVPTVRRLLALGHDVVAIDNFSVGSRERLLALGSADRLSIVEVDLTDARGVGRVVREANPWGIIHLAALHFIPTCVARPADTIAVNVLGTQHLLDAIDNVETERLVFASTADVYRPSCRAHRESDCLDPINVYGASKLMGERLVRFQSEQNSIPVRTIARLFNVYGPGETNPHVLPAIFEQLRRGSTVALGNMAPRRDYTFVEDVARVLVDLLTASPFDVTVNVGSGTSSSVETLVERIGHLLGHPISVRTDPAKVRRSDRPRLEADTSRLRGLLPHFAPTALVHGLWATLHAEGLLGRTALRAM